MSAIFGEKLVFGQQNGPTIELVVFGDEFYARYETTDGYTVIYDLDLGQYCYAVLEDGRFASSRTPVTRTVPFGFRKHIRESGSVRSEKFNRRYQLKRTEIDPYRADSNVMRTYGPNSGLLSGRRVSSGDVKGLTILVDFPDLQSDVTAADVEAMLNIPNYSAYDNFCSVYQYYLMMSGGKLRYTNKVVGPVRLSQKQSFYINTLLIEEAMMKAMSNYQLDLSEFDAKKEGIVDAISFMYAGRTQYSGELWPHNYVCEMRFGNYKTRYYTLQSLGRNCLDLSIGTFAHESGHMLCRFPDLYDYGQRDNDFEESSGLGSFCLMSSGNHLGYGKTPSPICAYLRDLVEWCDHKINLNNPGNYEAKHGDYGTVFRFSTDKSNEYFLLENRHREGLDKYLPDKGLAVYHCDTRGSNEYQDGTPDHHYQCALIQADGHLDLEHNIGSGDEGDLFDNHQGIALSDMTKPHSRQWDGTDSGLIISNIGTSGTSIPFQTGPPAVGNRISKSAVVDLVIPDNDPTGVSGEISIDVNGILQSILVDVKITHTGRGNLKIVMASPSGKKVTLWNKQGGKQNNLVLHLDSKTFGPLADLSGESVEGIWKLTVSDLKKKDTGRFDNWGLTIDYDSQVELVRGDAIPGLAIPDYDLAGIRSTINIGQSGKIRGISVEVDITHPYKGDVQIALISPAVQYVLLKPANGFSGNNIVETYSEKNTLSLKALMDQEIKGDWTLHVSDHARRDTGILNRWALKLLK